MNLKDLKIRIDRIFAKEEREIKEAKSCEYGFESSADYADDIRLSEGMSIEVYAPGENIRLIWDTYFTLKKFYDSIPTNLREDFILIVKTHLFNGKALLWKTYEWEQKYDVYKIRKGKNYIHKTKSSLAFYFLLKTGNLTAAIREMIDEVNQNNPNYITKKSRSRFEIEDDTPLLLDSIQFFVHYEGNCFKKEELIALEKIAEIYNHKLIDKIGDFFYENLKKSLDGNIEEIEFYRDSVLEKINKFDFDSKLSDFMNEIYEDLYLDNDKKSTYSGLIGSLREFFTHLRRSIAKEIEIITGDKLKDFSPGKVQKYLNEHLTLNSSSQTFIGAIVDIQNEEGGHDYISERKYAILVKNIVLELSYLLLESLDEFARINKKF